MNEIFDFGKIQSRIRWFGRSDQVTLSIKMSPIRIIHSYNNTGRLVRKINKWMPSGYIADVPIGSQKRSKRATKEALDQAFNHIIKQTNLIRLYLLLFGGESGVCGGSAGVVAMLLRLLSDGQIDASTENPIDCLSTHYALIPTVFLMLKPSSATRTSIALATPPPFLWPKEREE